MEPIDNTHGALYHRRDKWDRFPDAELRPSAATFRSNVAPKSVIKNFPCHLIAQVIISALITTVKVVVKKQNVFITCSGIVGAPPTIQRICSPM